ncbi:MAG: NAD(+)/NADH kinase [Lachnospiraceae bacterium]
MKHFFMITNLQKDPSLEITHYLEQYCKEHEADCIVQVTGDTGIEEPYTRGSDIPPGIDCIIVLGGDGTLLQAARDTQGLRIPLIGVNLGTLGYLAEIEQPNLERAMQALLMDEYEIESRMMLEGRVIRAGETLETGQALNDIIVARCGSLRIMHFNIYVNGQFLKEYQADGIIVATPTGSTGYNMSAGGPIVEPKAKLLLLTPICPHTFNNRSIILAPEDVITLEIGAGRAGQIQEIEVNYDGSHRVTLLTGDRIEIQQSTKQTDIIKLNKVSFLEVLHKKMSES